MASQGNSTGTIERKTDGGTDPAARVKYWQAELDTADRTESDWRKVVKDIVALYRNEKKNEASSRFNILYSSTETLRSALYNQTPTPDVRRRFKDKDPVGKVAAEVIERAISFDLDNDEIDDLIEDVVHDSLLAGRGVGWVDYDPLIAEADGGKDEAGNTRLVEHLADERVPAKLIDWADFRMSPAKRWKLVRWVARRLYPTRKECVEKFGAKIGEKIPLVHSTRSDKDESEGPEDAYKRAIVWQIWSKEERRVIHIAEGYAEGPAKEEDDPYNLRDFFPCPPPFYRVKTTGSMVPIPEYTLYEDQAKELETVSRRIIALTEVLKARGWRAADEGEELDAIEDLADGQLAPVVNWQQYANAPGGFASMIAWMPIQTIAAVIVQLYDARERIKQVIYEITGQADILRGASDPRETAKAQGIKARYGGLRLQRGQRGVQRFIRDLIRIKSEIIAEKFEQPTLQAMTGIDLPDAATRDAAKAQISGQPVTGLPLQPPGGPAGGFGGQPPAPPPPIENAAEIAAKPTWDEVMAVLRSEPLRQFRIDIETDSTIQPDAAEEQKNRVEFLTAVTSLITGLAPLVGSKAIPIDTARDLILFGARGFKVGAQLEDALDRIGRPDAEAPGQAPPGQPGQGQPGQPDPATAEAATKAAADQAQTQAETEGKLAIEQAQAEADAAVNRQKAENDAALEDKKLQAANAREMFKVKSQAWLQMVTAQAQASAQRDIELMKLGLLPPGSPPSFQWPEMPDFSAPPVAQVPPPAPPVVAPVQPVA